jgi:hypothetical protein
MIQSDSVWQLIDRTKAQQETKRLTTWLSAAKKDPQSGATDAGKDSNNLTNPTSKDSSNETI